MSNKTLEELRSNIDQIDTDIVNLFIKRMEIVDQIGMLKNEENIPVMRYGREIDIINRLKKLVKPEFHRYITDLFNTIFKISKDRQCEVVKE